MNNDIIIYEFLKDSGIKCTQVGFTYLCSAIEKAIDKGIITALRVNSIYRDVATEYDTTMTNVERTIRYALKSAKVPKRNAEFILESAFEICKTNGITNTKYEKRGD